MKACSLCNRTYDDRVDFCFAEGEPLSFAPARAAGEGRAAGRKVSTLVPVEAPSAPVLPDRVQELNALGPDPTIIPEDDDEIGPVYLPEETAPVVAELDDEDMETPPTPVRRPPTLSDEFGIPDAPPPMPISVEGEELEGPAPVEFPRAQPGRVPAAQRPGFRPPTADAILPPEEDETEDRVDPPAAGTLRPPQSSAPEAEEEEHGPYWGRIIVAALLLFGLVGGVMKVLFGSDDGDVVAANTDPPVEPVRVDPPTAPVQTPPVVPPVAPPPSNVEVPVAQVDPPVAPVNPVPPTPPVNPVNPPVTPPANNNVVKPPPSGNNGSASNTPTPPVTPPPAAVASLRISVNPPNASVTVDGTALASGATSWSGAPGRHVVSGKAPGYKSQDKSVDLAASGGDVALVLEKEVSSGVVKLFGTPGSQVFVGDLRIDSLPAQIELAEGTYTFRVVMPDQSSYTVQKAVKFNAAGQPINVSLAPN